MRSTVSAFVASFVVILLHAGGALAHASLSMSDPRDGSVLAEAPAAYSLTFSEPVSPLALRIIRPDGSATQLETFVLRDRILDIEAPRDLGRGTHVLSWRVVSSDGHPIGGSVVFSIGEASAEAPLVQESVDLTVRSALWLSRIALYVGLFLGVGGAFAGRVLMPSAAAGRRTAILPLALGATGAALSVGLQGLDALGAPVARLADPIVWSTGFGTTYGSTVIAALVAFALSLAALAPRDRPAAVLAATALVVGAASLALSGHASAAAPQWLMRPAVFLHAAAIAVWIGALAPLGLALKRREAGAEVALRRFSRAIPLFVLILMAAGTVLAVVQLERPGALLDTAYGQVFLVKLALLVGLLVMAAVNRWALTGAVERGDTAARRRLVRSIAVETLVAVAIFGAAAAWRFTPPPRVLAAEAALPAIVQLESAKSAVVLWIGPGRAGPVDIVANVLASDFAPRDAREVSLTLSNPDAGIEAFRRTLTRGEGMADWHAKGVVIPLPGQWRVRVDVLITDFEIDRVEGEIRFRP